MDSPMIEVRSLDHSFGKEKVLKKVDLSLRKGRILGVLGPSGSGKTTLIRCIAGILVPSGGEIFVAGKKQPDREIAGIMGYMGQSDALYDDLSGARNLRFFATLYGLGGKEREEAIERALALTNLQDAAGKKVSKYSGGMKKRLSLSIALLHNPRVLLLDEPTVGIDPVLRAELWEEFRRLAAGGTSIVLSSHVMEEAERCDEVAMIFGGSILAKGEPAEIKRSCGVATIEDAFFKYRMESQDEEAAS